MVRLGIPESEAAAIMVGLERPYKRTILLGPTGLPESLMFSA